MTGDYHVLPTESGWEVKKTGASRASATADTKSAAIDKARTFSRNNGSELIIHNRDGKIKGKDSHGRDPFPPRG